MTYRLIDSGYGQKLEQFGAFQLIRPCPQAVWRPSHPELWKRADATFSREGKEGWRMQTKLPDFWTIEWGGIRFHIEPTEFGHLGVFPEHAELWMEMAGLIEPGMRVLNLFAYSGGATMAALQAKAEVCHLDASKGMVDWARENARLNQLESLPVRWIVDDAIKFLRREVKRGSLYEGILLDPPTFGRGIKGEVFKIESDLIELLELSRSLLSAKKRFLILSCHTPGFTPLVLEHVMTQLFGKEGLDCRDMALHSPGALAIPSGCRALKRYG